MDTKLPEDKRAQLDSIVAKMVANKEDDATIQFVVDDFKKKNSTTPVQTQTIARQEPNALGEFASGAVAGFSSMGRSIQGALSKGVDAAFGTQGFGAPIEPKIDTTAGNVGKFVGEALPYFVNPSGGVSRGVLRKIGQVAFDTAIGTAQTRDIVGGATIGVGGQVIGALGRPLKAMGEGFYRLAVPLNKAEAKIVQAYQATKPFLSRVMGMISEDSGAPVVASKTALQNFLIGTQGSIGVQAKRAQQAIWSKVVAPALKSVDATVNMNEFFDSVEQKIIKESPELTTQKLYLKALNAVREDYKDVQNVTVEQLQRFKEGWKKNLPQKVYRGEDISGAYNNIKNSLRSTARLKVLELIDDPTVKQAYIDYGNLKELADFGVKGMTRKVTGGTGTVLASLKDTIVTPIATIGGQVLYRTGRGLEFIGNVGAKTLYDIFNEAPNARQPETPPQIK